LIKEPARFKRQLALPKFAWEVLKERIAKILARNLKELQKEKK
jgi:hypothetical protein